MSPLDQFEQIVVWTLSVCVAVVITVALLRLIVDIVQILVLGLAAPLDHTLFQAIFGAIMTLLIALEFNHSIFRAAARVHSVVQVKTVLLIALLALSRKFIILDSKTTSATTIVSLAAALVALGGVYWLLRERDDRRRDRDE
jgi:uncharacterized membrane protein (DUF373 family)